MATDDKTRLERERHRQTPPNPADGRVADRNPDAITGAPGSHPVGTGVGAVGGGVAGAAIGSVIPGIGNVVGAVVGTIVGAVAGGYAGKGVSEVIDPTEEDQYWYDNYAARPYVREGAAYDVYRPAYQYGWETRARLPKDKTFDQVEPELRRGWETSEYCDTLNWDEASPACRDAWDRAEQRLAD